MTDGDTRASPQTRRTLYPLISRRRVYQAAGKTLARIVSHRGQSTGNLDAADVNQAPRAAK
jgi:hypothetical protein